MAKENLQEIAHDAADGVGAHGVTEVFYQDPKFWVAIGFAIFVLLAIKYIVPPIGRSLDKRADAIRDQLEQAARLRAEAEELLATYERQQKEMLKEAETILEHAKRDAVIIRDKAAVELKQALERRVTQAHDTIARAESQAVAQLRLQLVDKATEATRLVVAEQLGASKEDPSVARALAAIERQIH